MRYEYYKLPQTPRNNNSNLMKLALASLIVVIIVVWVIIWNSANVYEPDEISEQAFYEGYFTMSTRLDQTLARRFPSLEFVDTRFSDDGRGTHTFQIKDKKRMRPSEIEEFLESSLGGYGFLVKQEPGAPDYWEYQIIADSTVWALYRIQIGYEEVANVSILPADLAKVTNRPRLAVVIDDFGYSMNETINGFISLNETFTAAVIPGRPYSTSVDERLKSRGIQTLIHMPMITVNNTTSEPDYALSDDLSEGEIQRRLRRAKKDVPNSIGMNNHQGSGGTQSRKVMREVTDFLGTQDMFFVDSRTIAASVGEKVAREKEIPTISRDVFLDEVDDPKAIAGELLRLARMAKDNGEAVGIGHCRPNTLIALKKYFPALVEAGFELVPVSQLVN